MTDYKKIIVLVLVIISLIFISAFKKEEVNTELDVTSTFTKSEFLNKGKPVMYDLGGHNCVSCQQMRDALVAVSEEIGDLAYIKFIDVVEFPHLATEFELSVIPTQYFYDKDGKFFKKNEGSLTKEQIYKIFEEMGYSFD